jgi:hypothetical protein
MAFLKHGLVQPFGFVLCVGHVQEKNKSNQRHGKKLLDVGPAGLQSAFENKGFLQHFCPYKSAKRKN